MQGASPTSAIGDAMVGSSPMDSAAAMGGDFNEFRTQAQQLNAQLQSMAQQYPVSAQIFAQMADMLKAAVIAQAKAGAQQTASGLAVPSGGVTA